MPLGMFFLLLLLFFLAVLQSAHVHVLLYKIMWEVSVTGEIVCSLSKWTNDSWGLAS